MQARTPSCPLQLEGQVTAFAGPARDSKMPDGLSSPESKEGLGEPWGQHTGPVPSCVHVHGVPALRAPPINQSPRPGRASHPQRKPSSSPREDELDDSSGGSRWEGHTSHGRGTVAALRMQLGVLGESTPAAWREWRLRWALKQDESVSHERRGKFFPPAELEGRRRGGKGV